MKYDEAMQDLENIWKQASEKFDLSDNTLKSGVKVGGDITNGRQYIDLYISYKRKNRWNAGLAYHQKDKESGPKIIVKKYYKGENTDPNLSRCEFEYENKKDAIDLFIEHIKNIQKL